MSAFNNKHRINKIICAQPGFTHQAAAELVLSHAAQTGQRKLARTGRAWGMISHFKTSRWKWAKTITQRFC
jgi:hypothetical protein